jgi:hypothetical protein
LNKRTETAVPIHGISAQAHSGALARNVLAALFVGEIAVAEVHINIASAGESHHTNHRHFGEIYVFFSPSTAIPCLGVRLSGEKLKCLIAIPAPADISFSADCFGEPEAPMHGARAIHLFSSTPVDLSVPFVIHS